MDVKAWFDARIRIKTGDANDVCMAVQIGRLMGWAREVSSIVVHFTLLKGWLSQRAPLNGTTRPLGTTLERKKSFDLFKHPNRQKLESSKD